MLRIITRALVRAALPGLIIAAVASPAAHAAGEDGAGTLSLAHHHHAATRHHAVPGRALRLGMHGHAVRVLQRELTRAGYPTAADGQFGRRTRAHLIAFERAHGIPERGVFGGRVRRALTVAETGMATTADGPGQTATIGADGQLTLPAGAPAAVQQIVSAANEIIDTRYVYGGGHGSFASTGYDCSGAVSFALHGGDLLASPEDSTGLESFGAAGPGAWVSVYADAAHTFLVVAGRAFDTADFGGPNIPSGSGPRWRSSPLGNLSDHGGYVVRHPVGL